MVGIFKNLLVGRVFFEKETLNSERFYNFLNTKFLVMDELTIEDRRNIIFQLDGS